MRREWILVCWLGLMACLVRSAIAQETQKSGQGSAVVTADGAATANSNASHDRRSPNALRSSASEQRAARIEGEKLFRELRTLPPATASVSTARNGYGHSAHEGSRHAHGSRHEIDSELHDAMRPRPNRTLGKRLRDRVCAAMLAAPFVICAWGQSPQPAGRVIEILADHDSRYKMPGQKQIAARSRVWDFMLKPGIQEFSVAAPDEPGEYLVVCTVICSQDHEGMNMKFVVLP